jgi:DNA-binding NarL/FixJ family response regulator
LTPRERDVVEEVLKGKNTKSIAQQLGTTDQVVRNHLHAIYRQLRVANRAELVAALSE